MTEKDIKDYCKNCSVEPPAMKFKCPECEHNPDKEKFAKDIKVPHKEQIIIDGCNVLKCRYYQYKTLKDCEMRYPESGDCEIGLLNYLFNGNLDMEKLCIDNPNCYFKQLTRKTQECEELKKENRRLLNKCIEQKCKIIKLIDENATSEVIYKINGKCAKTVANKVKEIAAIVEGKDCKYNRYLKALEEIEDFRKKHCDFWCEGNRIPDIINKAKGD